MRGARRIRIDRHWGGIGRLRYHYVEGTCNIAFGKSYKADCKRHLLGICDGWHDCREHYHMIVPSVCTCAKVDLFNKHTHCDAPAENYHCGGGIFEQHCVLKL